jgi:hypothetical protein
VSIERQQGKVRVRPARADRTPRTAAAALAAPYRDPQTGRWGPGNPGARLRQAAALGKAEAESLLRLPLESVAPWLRSHLQAAQAHAQQLVDALPVKSAELVALAGDEAKARLLANACMTEGSRVDCNAETSAAWREEARAWLREARQCALTRKGLARDIPTPPRDGAAEQRQLEAQFGRGAH